MKEPATAPDLKGFGSRAWLAGMLDPAQVGGDRYFGGTKFKDGKMAKWVRDKLSKKLPAKQAELNELIAAVSAEAGLKSQRAIEAGEQALILKGRGHVSEEFGCTDCHQFRKPDEDATAPDLTGWGSREWLLAVIANPTHERFYGKKNDRMPKFKDDGILNDQAIGLLADWLRGDWYVPGETATAK